MTVDDLLAGDLVKMTNFESPNSPEAHTIITGIDPIRDSLGRLRDSRVSLKFLHILGETLETGQYDCDSHRSLEKIWYFTPEIRIYRRGDLIWVGAGMALTEFSHLDRMQ